jgi:protein-disulfide isomerase
MTYLPPLGHLQPAATSVHGRGPEGAPLDLLEYGDYECPYCAEAYPAVKALERRLGSLLRTSYRHFPLTTVHRHAELAAEAAEAAGSQGKFWAMHSMLYKHHPVRQVRTIFSYAAALRLDATRFECELRDHVHLPRIHEDFMGGVRHDVTDTPAFFINGVRHHGRTDYDGLLRALEGRLSPSKPLQSTRRGIRS